MQNNNKNYKDITKDILKNYKKLEYKVVEKKYYIDDNGNKHKVDGKHVILKTTSEERNVSKILGKIFGGRIYLLPVVLYPQKIQTPDYMVNGQKFDLKQIIGNGKNTLDMAISKKKQQSNNFIFDISKTKMSEEQALIQIERIYNAKNRMWIDIIILIKNNYILKILKRK